MTDTSKIYEIWSKDSDRPPHKQMKPQQNAALRAALVQFFLVQVEGLQRVSHQGACQILNSVFPLWSGKMCESWANDALFTLSSGGFIDYEKNPRGQHCFFLSKPIEDETEVKKVQPKTDAVTLLEEIRDALREQTQLLKRLVERS
jgi:hypothetical protein